MIWPIEIFTVLALLLGLTAFVIGLMALSNGNQPIIQRQIVIKDDAVSMKDGVIFAKGFSNEPFKSTEQVSAVMGNTVTARVLTDGQSIMKGGNMTVSHAIQGSEITDGTLMIARGDLTTTGHISADRLTINRGITVPAEYYADVMVMGMNPVSYTDCKHWKPLSATTNETQLFFPVVEDDLSTISHGVSLHDGNKVQLYKIGRWKYEFNFIMKCHIGSRGNICIALSEDEPKLAHGYGVGNGEYDFVASGSGTILVNDIDNLYRLWAQHLTPQDGEDSRYTLQLQEGMLSLYYIGL